MKLKNQSYLKTLIFYNFCSEARQTPSRECENAQAIAL
jgi:hypothetical protein